MRSILVPPTFHIASLKRYTPNFSGPPQKLTCRLASRSFQSQVTQIRVHQNRQKWGVSLHKIDFPGKMVNCCLQHTIHILKAIVLAVILVYLGILWPVRFFVTFRNQLAVLAETLSYGEGLGFHLKVSFKLRVTRSSYGIYNKKWHLFDVNW